MDEQDEPGWYKLDDRSRVVRIHANSRVQANRIRMSEMTRQHGFRVRDRITKHGGDSGGAAAVGFPHEDHQADTRQREDGGVDP